VIDRGDRSLVGAGSIEGIGRLLVRYRSRGSVAGLRSWCSEEIGRLLVRYRSLLAAVAYLRLLAAVVGAVSIAEGIGRLLLLRGIADGLLLVSVPLFRMLRVKFACFDRSQVYR
jgi:hypothetical protein